MNGRKDIRDGLREQRKKIGATQQDIADILEIDRSTYAYYESGRLQIPYGLLMRLAAYYSIPVAAFTSGISPSVTFRSDSVFDYEKEKLLRLDATPAQAIKDVLTEEEIQLLSQLRARSCLEDEEEVLKTLHIAEYSDDKLLSYLVDPDEI